MTNWQAKIPVSLRKPLRIGTILVDDMNRADVFKHASAMAYVTLLSVIPSLAAIFALISLFSPVLGGSASVLERAKDFVLSNLAAGSGEQAVQYIESFLGNLDMTKIGLTGLAGLMVSLILLLRQIELALNSIWLVKKERNVITRFIYFWTFLTLGTFLLAIVIGFLAGPQIQNIINFVNFGQMGDAQRGFFSKSLPWIASGVFFFLLYKIVPNCYVTAKQALFGAVPALIMFNVAGGLYGKFAAKFTSYQAIYGALAALPLFLTWLYIIWLIILFGALLSWRAQQGFQIAESEEEIRHKLTPQEKLRDHEIQSLVPYLVMLVVIYKHRNGDGKGVSGSEVSNLLNMPPLWIHEAADFLLDRGYVVLAQGNDADQQGNVVTGRMYPATAPEAVTVEQLFTAMTEDALKWLHTWNHDLPLDLKHTLEKYWVVEPNKDNKSNLAAVLDKLQLTQAR